MVDILLTVIGTAMGLAIGLAPFAAMAGMIWVQATDKSL